MILTNKIKIQIINKEIKRYNTGVPIVVQHYNFVILPKRELSNYI